MRSGLNESSLRPRLGPNLGPPKIVTLLLFDDLHYIALRRNIGGTDLMSAAVFRERLSAQIVSGSPITLGEMGGNLRW